MRVRLALDANDHDRYVVARYFGDVPGASETDRGRTRATRAQVRAFARAAFRTFIAERAGALRGRQQSTAERLRDPAVARETLARPQEIQPSLL